MEEIIQNLSNLNPIWVYIIVASAAYIENLFPPFPSDVIVVAAGSIVALGRADLIITLGFATAGGTFGFISMYLVGNWFGDKIVEKKKIKFIPLDQVHKAEAWFKRYGYTLIVANRFLAGTRAVVSFFAGMSDLILWKTIVLCFASSLVWNLLLLSAGKTLGNNWQDVLYYLEGYSTIVTTVIILVVLLLIGRYFYKRSMNINRNAKSNEQRG